MYTCTHVHVHESSKGSSYTTNTNLVEAIPVPKSGTKIIPVQKVEPLSCTCRCLTLRTGTGRFKCSFVPCVGIIYVYVQDLGKVWDSPTLRPSPSWPRPYKKKKKNIHPPSNSHHEPTNCTSNVTVVAGLLLTLDY